MAPRGLGPVHVIAASQGETVSTFSELTKDQLTEAHDSADKLIGEKYRSYLPGRLLPLLLSRYRDDLAEAVKLSELTTGELNDMSGAVQILATRYAGTMDDPALPDMLRKLRDTLVIEKAERAGIAADMRARAS